MMPAYDGKFDTINRQLVYDLYTTGGILGWITIFVGMLVTLFICRPAFAIHSGIEMAALKRMLTIAAQPHIHLIDG